MNTKLLVENLAATTTERALQSLFSAHGNVAEVNLPLERESGRPRGFAIVTMATPEGARSAILALNGKEVEARMLMVVEHVTAKKVSPVVVQKGKAPQCVRRQEVSAFRRLFGIF